MFKWIVTSPSLDSGWTYCGKIDKGPDPLRQECPPQSVQTGGGSYDLQGYEQLDRGLHPGGNPVSSVNTPTYERTSNRMPQPDPLLRGTADIQRPELRDSARADSRAPGQERHRQNHHDQHPERLPAAPLGRMPDLRRGYPPHASPDPGAHRPAHRGARSVRLHDHRTDRTLLRELLPPPGTATPTTA